MNFCAKSGRAGRDSRGKGKTGFRLIFPIKLHLALAILK